MPPRLACLDRPASGRDDMLHDGEAEAGPTRSSSAITPVKALEETRQVVRIDPDTVVSGGNDNVAVVLANHQSEGRARTGMALTPLCREAARSPRG